jgi:hypothetical protein
MSAEKTVAVSFRVSPRFKHLLEAAAAREHRSQTNMLETLLFDYCEQLAIEAPSPAAAVDATAPTKNKKGHTK